MGGEFDDWGEGWIEGRLCKRLVLGHRQDFGRCCNCLSGIGLGSLPPVLSTKFYLTLIYCTSGENIISHPFQLPIYPSAAILPG